MREMNFLKVEIKPGKKTDLENDGIMKSLESYVTLNVCHSEKIGL